MINRILPFREWDPKFQGVVRDALYSCFAFAMMFIIWLIISIFH